jgi:hypothetical protein
LLHFRKIMGSSRQLMFALGALQLLSQLLGFAEVLLQLSSLSLFYALVFRR